MRAITHRAVSLFVVLLLFPAARADVPSIAPPTELRGALVIAGGGDLPDAVRDRFLDLAGGKDARLVLLAADDAEAAKEATAWKNRRVTSVVRLQARDPTEADTAAFAAPLRTATGIWIAAGDRSRTLTLYRGTAVEKELHQLLNRGGTVGGTAAVLGQVTAVGGFLVPEVGAGLGLLPGAVIEEQPLGRNRVDRLLQVLAKHPGCFGLGVEEQTAVLVKGRRLNVVGKGYAVTCLSASSRRPASVQVLRPGELADLIALGRAARARSGPPFPADKPEPPVVPNGTLFIGGGGGLTTDIVKRFVDTAGGPDALIVVVPAAMEDPIPEVPGEVRMLRRAGARNVKVLHTRDRTEADRPEFLAPFRAARGVWFTGGRQWHFVDSYEGTATERFFHEVLHKGGVIGGSSAGASIQSEYMPRGDPLGNLKIMAEGYERGFGFLKGVAVDQHFFARRRTRDMSELMAVYPQLLGIGIDEGTVIIVHGSEMEVVGRSKVAVYDRRKPAGGGKDFEEVPAGARYDLVKRRRIP
jgi:cyanophycinase